MRVFFKILLILLLVVLAAAILLIGYLTLTEYRPEEQQTLAAPAGKSELTLERPLTIFSYNTGYAGLDRSMDFFMDGGKQVHPENEQQVSDNLKHMTTLMKNHPADIYLLQEVDVDSRRSFRMDQTVYYQNALRMDSVFACNYKCDFVPFPLPMIGKVESGLLTMTNAVTNEASRTQLPVPFSWPIRTANLKRCLLTTRFPLKGSNKELVLINLHLEAYDDGEGKLAQTKMLSEILQKEYQKGNYVIAGGDFNQAFPETLKRFPLDKDAGWQPGLLTEDMLPEGFRYVYDDKTATCRLLDKPYDPETSQLYVIDGYIVSDNVKVKEVSTVETGFAPSDHQPVKLTVTLVP